MGKFSDIEKALKELDQKYQTKWDAEKKAESNNDSIEIPRRVDSKGDKTNTTK